MEGGGELKELYCHDKKLFTLTNLIFILDILFEKCGGYENFIMNNILKTEGTPDFQPDIELQKCLFCYNFKNPTKT